MNYVGSVSIIDRGDAPAKAVIDKNTRSLAQRVADETKEELDKVMDRVDNIYVSYEMSTQTMFSNPRDSPNVEYLEDIKELEGILTDAVKKKKYQQQVTVFVVGFQDICAQKLHLMQQVNQFFMENTIPDDDELLEEKTEVDLDDANKQVHDSLNNATELAKRLGDLNQDIIEWLVHYANNKASNKGKKRLEKNLDLAKTELTELSEKLLKLQTELEEKDEKFQLVAKQLDTKTQEALRYKTAADIAKNYFRYRPYRKSAQDNENHTAMLSDEIKRRDEKIQELRSKVSKMEINLTESQFDTELVSRRMDKSQAQTKVDFIIRVDMKEKLAKLQEEVDTKRIALSDAEREMEKIHKDQLLSLQKEHHKEIDELKVTHEDELAKLTGKSFGDLSGEEHQESRPSTKDTKSSKKSDTLKPASRAQGSKSPSRIVVKEKSGRISKDVADASIQDEGGDVLRAHVEKSNEPSRQPTRQSKNLETVIEGGQAEFTTSFELDDEESWMSVPANHVPGRFLQFRQLSRVKVKELEDQLQMTLTKTHRKVNSLKSQFNEHKGKWETERKILIEQVEQAQKLQTDAEKEADAAMTQLEEFINEQEKLEDEEEAKRQEIMKAMSRPGTTSKKRGTPTKVERKPSVSKEEKGQGERLQSENSETELNNLLQQTDDAKGVRIRKSKSRKKRAQNQRQVGALSAPPAIDQDLDTPPQKSQVEIEPITGNSDEEVRMSSAKSRASLRNQFKSRLDETRQAAESRRTKSPIINLPAQKSVDDELIDDDDDEDLPIPDDQKEEALFKEDTLDAGTSPIHLTKEGSRKISVASRKSTNLSEHPLVTEYLRAYSGIHKFKEAMANVLVDKEQMSASQMLSDLDTINFHTEEKVVPQISNMTENIYYVLNEVSQVINSVLQNDRAPVVSSLMTRMSRDDTQRSMFRDKSNFTEFVPNTRQTQRTVSTRESQLSTDRQQFSELQTNYERLLFKQGQMVDESRKYEEQHQRNMIAMMEMQDTINHLQRELSTLGKQRQRTPPEPVVTAPVQTTESAIMFTRLDSERNAKIMKKAVNEEKLDHTRYKEAVVQMDEYVSLPAQRLGHLVRKYVHHCRMKSIEDNVQASKSMNDNVYDLLDKMEDLQSRRAKRWTDKMDTMGTERYRLANLLMETLDGIEQESGIFLIKPMYSYRGREPKERFSGKISRPFRPHRTLSPLVDGNINNSSNYAPAPTPASNIRPMRNQYFKAQPDVDQYPRVPDPGQSKYEPAQVLNGNTTGLTGSSVTYKGPQQQSTWSMSDSQAGVGGFMTSGNVNTPRILELDINRMMIGQNTISAQIGMPGLSNDRLVNASNSNLRSYMTVNRPGPGSTGSNERPRSVTGTRDSPTLSNSPTNLNSSSKRVRMSTTDDVPNVMSTSQPLPPISVNGNTNNVSSHDLHMSSRSNSNSTKGKVSSTPHRVPIGNDIPDSPPGSSLRNSPFEAEYV